MGRKGQNTYSVLEEILPRQHKKKHKQNVWLTLDNIDEGQWAVSEIRLLQVVGVVAGRALVAPLGTVLSGHSGLSHDKDIRHALARLVGGFVADLFHGGRFEGECEKVGFLWLLLVVRMREEVRVSGGKKERGRLYLSSSSLPRKNFLA